MVASRHAVHGLALGAAVALGLSMSACGRQAAPDRAPAEVTVGVLDGEATPEAMAPAPLPGALPTWTLGPPVGQPAGTPLPGGVAGSVNGLTPPAPAGGGIPAPTPRATVAVGQAGPPPTDPAIVALLGQVDAARLVADVTTLAGFGTRHALSSTDVQNRGVGAARDWLKGQLDGIAAQTASQLVTEWEDFPLAFAGQDTTQRNVIATLTGIGDTKRLVYVTAHYDSRAEAVTDGQAAAPGADDDASGTAALLELARVLGSRQWDGSIRLIAFAAEEPGLKGSRHHAPLAKQAGLPIVAVLNNDIIGATLAEDGSRITDRAQVFSAPPDDGPSRQLARYAQVMAARYGLLPLTVVPQADRAGRGGDHQPFSEAGFAALRLIEAADDQASQHSAADTPERIDAEYLAKMVQLNVALAANLALAPPAPAEKPTLAAAGAKAVSVTWAPVDAPSVAGYYVAWRPVNEPAYRAVAWAGPGTVFSLSGLPAGRVAVAVAAADDLGHMSPFGPEATR